MAEHEKQVRPMAKSASVKREWKITNLKILYSTEIIVVEHVTMIGDKHHCCLHDINNKYSSVTRI